MGWFDRSLFRRKIKNPVAGTAQIVSCSQPASRKAIYARCDFVLVVEAVGIAPYSVDTHCQVKVARWPSPGMTLPCTLDPLNPNRVDLDLDSLPDWKDHARAQADQIAAARASGTRGVGNPLGAVTVVGAASPAEAADAVRRAEVATGMDLNGDGQLG